MIEDVYKAALHSIEAGTPEDETFVVTFNNRVELTQDFTTDRRKLVGSIQDLKAGGMTALYDAVAFGLEKVKQGRHQKKALMVVTDGEDNVSRTSFAEVTE